MRVQDVMTTSLVTVSPASTVGDARRLLESNAIGHLVVMEEKKVAGVVSKDDLVSTGDDVLIEDVMTRRVAVVEPRATLRQAASIMNGRVVGCIPVVDDGVLKGIVTASDLLRALAKGSTHANSSGERVILRKRGPRKHSTPV